MSKKNRGSIFVESAEVLANDAFPGDQYVLRVRAPKLAAAARAGSFAHLQCDALLPMRRPLSVMRVDAQRGWAEFLVYPLFSPRSLIAEGSANFGIEVAFPGEERLRFERQELFPLAGLDAARAAEFYEIQELTAKLAYSGNEAARGYLDGAMSAEEAIEWMTTYSLSSRARAEQRLRFIEQYRSYVINYNLGQDLVRQYVEAQGGTTDNPDRRWREFEALLSSPRLPSGLGK